MSEIASKTNMEPNGNLAQPFAKKDSGVEHNLLFASLFGGVVATGTSAGSEADVTAVSPVFATADPDDVPNPEEHADILASMHAVAAMMSGHGGKGRKSEFSADVEKCAIDEKVLAEDNELDASDIVSANLLMDSPMPIQQHSGTSIPPKHQSAVIAPMAFEDEVVMPHRHTSRTAINPAIHSFYTPASQSQMAALSSSSIQTMKSAEKAPINTAFTKDMPIGELDDENAQPRSYVRSGGQAAIRPTVHQSQLNQAALAPSKTTGGSGAALTDIDGGMQFESSDEFMRVAVGQTERVVSRMSGQTASGESLSANAVRQMQVAGVSIGGLMSQQNNGQSSGQSGNQSGGFATASAGMTNGNMMGMLDMAQDNWTEMLLQRVERGLAGGKDKIDFHLNPRNLGKMRISLLVQNDRTSVHIQTETVAAAQMLSDAEARLAQMMDASGLKFGNLTSQYNQNFAGNFAGQNSGQGREGAAPHDEASATADGTDENNAEISVEQSENLVNMQA